MLVKIDICELHLFSLSIIFFQATEIIAGIGRFEWDLGFISLYVCFQWLHADNGNRSNMAPIPLGSVITDVCKNIAEGVSPFAKQILLQEFSIQTANPFLSSSFRKKYLKSDLCGC